MSQQLYFSEVLGKSILSKVLQKGWNAYLYLNLTQKHGSDAIIIRGPARSLEVGGKYLVLPSIEESSNPSKVVSALEAKLKGNPPTISITGETFQWTGFSPMQRVIVVETEIRHHLPYDAFLKALESITDISK